MWMFGPTCFVRVPPSSTEAQTLKREKWAVCPPEANFNEWLQAEIETLMRKPQQLIESLPEGSRKALLGRATVHPLDSLVDEACRILDLWKDPEDPTQIDSPLNKFLQTTKVGILSQLRASNCPELGIGDVGRELRLTLATAIAGVASRKKQKVPSSVFRRIDRYFDITPSLPRVKLASPYLRCLLLVVFARLVTHRFASAQEYELTSPLCQARHESGYVRISFEATSDEVLLPSDEHGLSLKQFTLVQAVEPGVQVPVISTDISSPTASFRVKAIS
jgi:hypothetical protein